MSRWGLDRNSTRLRFEPAWKDYRRDSVELTRRKGKMLPLFSFREFELQKSEPSRNSSDRCLVSLPAASTCLLTHSWVRNKRAHWQWLSIRSPERPITSYFFLMMRQRMIYDMRIILSEARFLII